MTLSLQGQIAEVEREIKKRKEVYPRLVGSRKMRQQEADMLIGGMSDVLATLRWLEEIDREELKAYLASRKEAKA